MNLPLLIFTKYKNSFTVHVENLEQLDVSQIQQLQDFVSSRNGVFDFESYTFSIQKKLEYDEFRSLLKHSSIDATCKEKRVKSPQNIQLPEPYLLWLKGNYRGNQRDIVDAEIKNRGI